MRTALISDIHSNFDALQAVARVIDQQMVDRIVCLGDVIGYGAQPQACLEWVDKNCDYCVAGNHEDMLCNELDAWMTTPDVLQVIIWTKKNINDAAKAMIKKWPLITSFEGIKLVHSSPYEPNLFHYVNSYYAAEEAFQFFSEQLCFIGHTHVPAIAVEIYPGRIEQEKPLMPFSLDKNKRYLINVGSVGQPRNGDPRAHWGIIDHSKNEISFHAVDYPINQAAEKIIKAGLPSRFATRLSQGR